MSELRRLLESEEASPEVLELLRAAKRPAALHAGARGRSWRRLAALIAIPAVSSTLSWATYAAYGAVFGAAVTAAVAIPSFIESRKPVPPPGRTEVRGGTPTGRPLPAPEHAVAPTAVEPPAPVAPPAVPRSSVVLHRESRQSDTDTPSLTREAALLERAQRALPANPGAALVLLRQHEAEFTHGVLEPEREFLVVDALTRLGRRSEAIARARALKSRSPKSLYSLRLEKLLSDASNDTH